MEISCWGRVKSDKRFLDSFGGQMVVGAGKLKAELSPHLLAACNSEKPESSHTSQSDNPRVTCMEAHQLLPWFQGIQKVKLILHVCRMSCFQSLLTSCLPFQPWEAHSLLIEKLFSPHIFIHQASCRQKPVSTKLNHSSGLGRLLYF